MQALEEISDKFSILHILKHTQDGTEDLHIKANKSTEAYEDDKIEKQFIKEVQSLRHHGLATTGTVKPWHWPQQC